MEQETTWQWRCDIEPDGTVVTLLGEIDMAGADHLRDVLRKAIAQATRVDVDLAQLTFIDSAVINTLVAAHKHAADLDVRLTLVNPTGHVRRVLAVTGILHTLGGTPSPPDPPA
ncbi:anti-sigma factor antagonist [Micromonospora sicca]|uniref:Anti-sigma factor antagonist n=1 Tax=Micromonospora sicca TaxID=2202420 RepID=A0A317D547_9ACTN|nr:STAS domain-containing protein [Micromonospora sp. 4G51]PWR09724.1 anti-sigma factor antagonist [Micromonospora sp. 4G51]